MGKGLIPVIHGADRSRPDEADTVETAEAIAATLRRLGYESEIIVLDLDLSALESLAARRPLVVFNLVEAIKGQASLAHLPCPVLDHLGLAYTGNRTGPFLATLSKLATKERLRAAGLPTADWWPRGAGVPPELKVIVKSDLEHASQGIDRESIVDGRKAGAEIARREARFGGCFFAEAFLAGREFNIALLETAKGPRVLPIPEIDFSGLSPLRPAIVDYDAKWNPADEAYHRTPRHFGIENREPALARTLTELALNAWSAFGCSGYIRVDIRADASGRPFILEINTNPCLAPDAGFAAAAAEAGFSYDAMIKAILEAAIAAGATRLKSSA